MEQNQSEKIYEAAIQFKKAIEKTGQKPTQFISSTSICMRIFYLFRKEDETGVSGTGFVAEGVVFSTGKIVMNWLSKLTSTCIYESIDDIVKIHGHNKKTEILWEHEDYINEKGEPIVSDGNWYYTNLITKKYIGWLSNLEGLLKISEFLKQKFDAENEKKALDEMEKAKNDPLYFLKHNK